MAGATPRAWEAECAATATDRPTQSCRALKKILVVLVDEDGPLNKFVSWIVKCCIALNKYWLSYIYELKNHSGWARIKSCFRLIRVTLQDSYQLNSCEGSTALFSLVIQLTNWNHSPSAVWLLSVGPWMTSLVMSSSSVWLWLIRVRDFGHFLANNQCKYYDKRSHNPSKMMMKTRNLPEKPVFGRLHCMACLVRLFVRVLINLIVHRHLRDKNKLLGMNNNQQNE